MPVIEVELDGGAKVQADVKKGSCVAVHRSADGKAWRLTHIPSGLGLTRVRLKKDAIELRKKLDLLDWSDIEAVRKDACRTMNLLE